MSDDKTGCDCGHHSLSELLPWISVTDRLPEEEGLYLIYAPSADPEKPLIFSAWWHLSDNPEWYKRWGLVKMWSDAVTYWMPLPDPPGGEER